MAVTSSLTEVAFAGRRQREWEKLEALLREAHARGIRRLPKEWVGELSPLYRDVCADLSRAEGVRYSAPLVAYLQGLTAAAHAALYESGSTGSAWARATGGGGSPVRVALEVFPRAVRCHGGAVLVASLLFFLPLIGGLLATLGDPTFAVRIVPESQLRPLAEAYRQGFEGGRGAGLDTAMAGFYVNNNVGIALRCFATGVFLGVGSALYLVENGLVTGAIMGYVATHGGGANILTFVVGHGSLELGAIVLAGAAGLSLGWSIVVPGERTRAASLQSTAKSVVVVVFGAAAMLLLAAAVEGFWSGSSVASGVKRSVGAVLFAIVVAYIALAGRGSREAEAFERAAGARPWT
jgi:uncharacterized membrane protein SpoIIM required for sporulation